jgi:uncharacterized protein (DUF1697 family)
MQTIVVLLRGINVGGRNKISMKDLQRTFADLGFAEPTTFIQSGNVIAGSRTPNGPALVRTIERGLSDAFGYHARVVVLDLAQMKTVVRQIPKDWDVDDASMRYNVIFTTHALYWSAPFETLTKTSMIKLSSHPSYGEVTIRNLRTTLKLLALMQAHAAG